MDLTSLFHRISPAVVAFISTAEVLPEGERPPSMSFILGTGFLVHPNGIAVTNNHVIETFEDVPKRRDNNRPAIGALFFHQVDARHTRIFFVEVVEWYRLGEFEAKQWYGSPKPDFGFVQLMVRDAPFLELADEDYYLQIGNEIVTVGYPTGREALTIFGNLNQLSPFIRRGIVSSVFPFPTAQPHGFTIDVLVQGGASGSPIVRTTDGRVVGILHSSLIEPVRGQLEDNEFVVEVPVNITLAETSALIRDGLAKCLASRVAPNLGKAPTFKEIITKQSQGDFSSGFPWES